jgi:hypothetical protein
MKTLGSLLFAALLVGSIFVAMDRLTNDQAYGQAATPQSTIARSGGDLTLTLLNVQPNGNTTNVATFFDQTGTNWARFNPTNASFWIRQQGSNSFAPPGPQTVNLFVGITNNQTGKQLIFVNGLFMGTQ